MSANDVHREFITPEKKLEVLRGVNLQANKGEMISIAGPSGVGKSTLLHILGGLDQPTTGEVKISGQVIKEYNETAMARFRNDKIGFVFQAHYLMGDFSALENVMIPILISGQTRKVAAQKGELLLEQVGLKDRTSHLPKHLSGGEQQRVAVARALANDPEIVLADEPSGNLDTESGHKLHDLLFELNATNQTTFIIATHNRELWGNCHLRLELRDGKIYT